MSRHGRWRPGRWVTGAALLVALVHSGPAHAQAGRAWGRVAFFADTSRLSPNEGESRSLDEFVTTVTYRSAEPPGTGVDFGLDTRFAGYSGSDRDPRVSIYDAWAGARLMGGAVRVRAGQMWLSELGGIGAIAGGVVEYRRPLSSGQLRFAGFGGLEPKAYEAGYVSDVRRYGGYGAFDGKGSERSVVGWVLVRNQNLTERSVLTTTNYVPIGKTVFVYQAAEVDLQGPAGQGSGGLTYFFTNARIAPTPRVDVQATYHRGRSIDARTITLDQLNGRAIPPRTLDGLLFESAGARVTVEVVRGVRIFGGFGQDKNNADSEPANRVTAGAYTSNVARSGLDATVSFARTDRGTPGSFDSWYVSVGRSISAKVYLSGDYTSSLSVLRTNGTDGLIVETRPHTDRFSASAIVNLTRLVSLLFTGERTNDDTYAETRLLAGLSYRLP
jgi:hypothetical protein